MVTMPPTVFVPLVLVLLPDEPPPQAPASSAVAASMLITKSRRLIPFLLHSNLSLRPSGCNAIGLSSHGGLLRMARRLAGEDVIPRDLERGGHGSAEYRVLAERGDRDARPERQQPPPPRTLRAAGWHGHVDRPCRSACRRPRRLPRALLCTDGRRSSAPCRCRCRWKETRSSGRCGRGRRHAPPAPPG